MILTAKVVNSARQAIYGPPMGKRAEITNIIVANTSDLEKWVVLYINEKSIGRKLLDENGGSGEYGAFKLGAGDYISGQAEDGSSVDCVISGEEFQ